MRAHLALPPLRAHAAAALLRRGALGPVRPRGHLAVIHCNKEEVTRAVNDHSRSGDSLLALLYAMLNGVDVDVKLGLLMARDGSLTALQIVVYKHTISTY